MWKISSSSSRSSEGSPPVSISSLPASSLSSIWLASVFFLHNPCGFAFRNTLYDYIGNSNIVEVYISGLRKKIDADFEHKLIHTVRSVGYTIKE